ncbi:Uu.00g043420.m01.CDS01 [Anthostomella pinea]|uniref:Uu.00g043420.m01.CDS01 n=1 Tax=Anthostomella pinea TaxID=933095 RepID=A0AAI8VAP0_9PEZI|nr:Uu.00g043420.m01.CDS01 [Anthostomella pinea]
MDDATRSSIAQAAVAGGCLLIYFARYALPEAPQWLRPFAREENWRDIRERPWTIWAISLQMLSIIGLIITAVTAVISSPSVSRILELAPWAAALLIAAVDRPRKTPKALLALYVTILACGVVSLAATYSQAGLVHVLNLAAVCVALAAVVAVLAMPMRDPDLGDAFGIAGSEEPPTSQLRSPEDNLTPWQFMTVSWLAPLISRGYCTRLDDGDVWCLPYDFQHSRLLVLFRDLQGSIIRRLLCANGLDLAIITGLGVLEAVANLSVPVLLQHLLQSIERGPDRRNGSVAWALAILAVRLVAAQSNVFSLWFSRRAYERSRGEMLTTIYAKTLTRKSFGLRTEEKEDAPTQENGHQNGNGNGAQPESNEETHLLGGTADSKPKKSRMARLLGFLKLRKRSAAAKKKAAKAPAEQPATMGKILNLMRNDVYEVAQRFWEFPSIVTKPLQLVLSVALVWQLLGWPCLLGMAWVVTMQTVNAVCVRRLLVNERLRRAASDVRLHATSQFVEAIRPLRWYDWQSKWLTAIMEAREKELHLRIRTGLWNIAIGATNLAAGALFPVFSFFAYTYIAERPLPIDVAFPALQLFTMLEGSLKELPNLITVLLNASVAIGRLEAFMAEHDKEEGAYNDSTSQIIEFRGASFEWTTNHKRVLEDLTLSFSTGLTVVCGKVGSGKTALLQAILGELDKVRGGCVLPNEMVGYCAQAPWLQNMSIRDNILFNFPFDGARYRKVLDACQLTQDLANFAHGDLSNIGENGIGLSGGQKARVALARAVYSKSRILLLDDPLAALDHNTAEAIVRKLFRGSLVAGRTVVLVTHRVDMCTHLADQVVEITDGRARVLHEDEIAREIDILAREQETLAVAREEAASHEAATEEQQAAGAGVPDKFVTDENRASGGVVARIYWTYIKAGRLTWWALVIAIFSGFRFLRVFNSWFLKSWGEAYPVASDEVAAQVRRLSAMISSSAGVSVADGGIFDGLPSPDDDVLPWLMWYAILGVAMTVFFTLTQCGLLLILYTAAKDLFGRVLQRVSGATFRFYDVTPVGRLMNRLTSDIGMLDGGIIAPLQDVAFWSLTWATCMIVISATTPIFFAFALAMTAWFVAIFLRFLPTSQSLRRLEMVSLSPLMSNFGILLDGLATIRAFRAQPHFQDRNVVVTDAFQKMDHFYWSLQAWLLYRFDALSAVSTFALTLLALYQGLSPGLTAFVLTTASQFVDATHALCKAYGQLQMDFVSVERVVELLDLEPEPSGDVEPPAAWPAYGDAISFEGVTVRYAPHLEPSLTGVSFTIPGGATCAVLGRTGSGKSTLALALLATVRPDPGEGAGVIRVGGVDIARVDVHAWRRRLSFVAQDPVLFPGTLRDNLDPLQQHTDAECNTTLRRILGAGWTLSSRVDDGGKNLSQGQRQLVGIGRAVLRRSPVVILDEATASIDKQTALAIQEVLRDELRLSTVITIAHRIEAVRDADYFVRLDGGRVVEAGPAVRDG